MTRKFSEAIKASSRVLTAHEDYDGYLMEEEFWDACQLDSIFLLIESFGFKPLIQIDKIFIENSLYESLIESESDAVNRLLDDYSDSVLKLIAAKLQGGYIKQVNTNFDFVFTTLIPGFVAVTYMPQRENPDQGVCLYFGPAGSPEHLTQLIDGISDEVVWTCETSSEYPGA
ncbi:hypothetical protein MCEMSHM24_03594 [Comamonadaceae bacterium]